MVYRLKEDCFQLKDNKNKTYNTGDSLVVTESITKAAVFSLFIYERADGITSFSDSMIVCDI